MTLALDAVDRFLAELRAAQDDASLSSLAVAEGSFDEYEAANFVVNNLGAIRYALMAGMPITAWGPAQKNPGAVEKVLRAIRQFEEQAKLLVLAYTQGYISIDQFRASLRRVFHQQARNSYVAGRRAVGDLRPLTHAQERELEDAIVEDEDDLDSGLSLDPAVAAGGGLAAMLGAMLFDPSNYLGSGLPGDPLATLPAPIGAGKHAGAKDAEKALSKFGNAMSTKGDAIRSMSHVGELSALAGLPGDATLVWWTLGYADHCIDCIRLADGSPYYISVMNNNGLFPGSGHTRCGGRCRCSMEYDVPSEACSDGLAIIDGDPGDLSSVLESADGKRVNVWIMEAAACKLPVSIGSLNPSGNYGKTIDDGEAFSWDEDIAQIMTGSIETTTHTWTQVVDNAAASSRARDIQKAFDFIASDMKHLLGELRLTEYEASGSRYVMAWSRAGDGLVFHAGATLKGSTVLEPEFTLRALNDLAARAAADKLSVTVAGEYLGPGFRSWLNTIGAQQLVGTPVAPSVLIDYTRLGGELVVPTPAVPDPKLLGLLSAQPIEKVPVVEWDTAAAMVDDLAARYPGAQFDDLLKLDFELVKPAMQQMDAVFTRFGAIESFRGVRVSGLKPGVLAAVKRIDQSKPGSAIFLPKATWGDRAVLEKQLASQTSSSFSTATAVLAKDAADVDGYTKAIVTHELGHEYMGMSLFSRFGHKGDQVRRDVDTWFKGGQTEKAHGGFIASLKKAHLTKYADTNPHEAWAEAFTSAMKATPIHTEQTDALKAILDRAYPPAPARTVGPLIDANVTQASNRLTTAYAKWFDSMDDATQAAFVQYEKDSGGALNAWLRSGMPDAQASLSKALGLDLEAEVAALDKAIAGGHLPDQQVVVASSKLDKPLTVYRGRSLDVVPEVGDLVQDPAFLSTTLDPAQAASFAHGIESKEPVVYRIALPKGYRAAWMNGYFGDAYAYEEELLLPRNQAFHVVGKHTDEVINGEHVTVIDLVPEPAPLIPVGPAIAADDINAWAPLDAQQYVLPGGGPLLNEPLHEWSGFVPPEPEAPPLKASAAAVTELRKEWDAAKLTYQDVATGHTDLAISWTAADDKEAVKHGLVTGKGADGTYLVAKDQPALDEALAYLADKTHTADDDAFWKMLGYDDAAIAKHDAYEAARAGKRLTAGVMIVEPDGRMWVLAPKNKFAGYENTVIKGGVDPGETTAMAAIREVREEAGMSVELDSFLGDYSNTDGSSITRMYVGHRTGGGPLYAAEKETFKVRLLDAEDAAKALTRYGKPDTRDQSILADTVAQVVGKPASIDHVIPAAEMESFVAATAPLPVEPPTVGLVDRPVIDTTAFSRDARAALSMPPSADFGYDHSTVLGLSHVQELPPSTKFPIAQAKWTMPDGSIQPMFYKEETHAGGGAHIFWMNSKKQIADPGERLNVHVAQLLRFSEQLTDPSIVALRVNDSLLDQVPALRDILMAGGAIKPTPGTTELTISQLHALAETIKTEVPLTPGTAFIPTAELVPTPVTTATAGYDLKLTSDLLTSVTHEAANDGATGEFTWLTKSGKVQTGYVVKPTLGQLRVVAGDVPLVQRIDVVRSQVALLAAKAKADGLVIRLDAFTIDGLDLNELKAAIPGESFAGGYLVNWADAEQLHDTMLHDLTAMGHQPGALVEPLGDVLPSVAGIVEPVGSLVTGVAAQLTGEEQYLHAIGAGAPSHGITWKLDGAPVGRWVWTEGDHTIVVNLAMKSLTPDAAARQIAHFGDLVELHPKFETVIFNAGVADALPKSLAKMLDPTWVTGAPLHVTAEAIRGVRDSLFSEPILSHLPTIAPGPLPAQLSYKASDVVPLTGIKGVQLGDLQLHEYTADLGGGRIGEWQLIGDDLIVRDWKAGGVEPVQNGLGQLAFLYDRAGQLPKYVDRLLVPEAKFDPDVVASLVAAGGARKAGYVVMDAEAAYVWQTNVISEAAVESVVGPVISVAKTEASPLLSMVEHVEDQAVEFKGQMMKGSIYDGSGGIFWRRWSNTLEIHDVKEVSDVAIKAHLVRLAAAADASPKIVALRILPGAYDQMSTHVAQLLADAGATPYPGGVRLTADQLKALRSKLLDDAKTLAVPEPVVPAYEPQILSADGVAMAGPLTFTKTELKYFDQYDWTQPGWDASVRVTQRRLAKEILWARTTGEADQTKRFTASMRHLATVGNQMAADPKIERLRIENLQQLPSTVKAVLKSLPGASATDAVIYVPSESVIAFGKQIEADLGHATVSVATPAVTEADQGILGIAGHDDIDLNAMSGDHGTAYNYGEYATTAYGNGVTVYTTGTPYDIKIVKLDGPSPYAAVDQASFLHMLDEFVLKADADGKTLSIAADTFIGQAGQDIKAKLLELGAQMDGGNVVIPKNMLVPLSNHIQMGVPLVVDPAIAIPLAATPASSGAKLSAQFGISLDDTQAIIPSPWMYSDGSIKVGSTTIAWNGAVHTADGSVKLAVTGIAGSGPEAVSAFLSSLHTITSGLPAAGPDGLIVSIGGTPGLLHDILKAAGGTSDDGYWIAMDESALIKLASHVDEDKALRVVPQGSSAANAPLAVSPATKHIDMSVMASDTSDNLGALVGQGQFTGSIGSSGAISGQKWAWQYAGADVTWTAKDVAETMTWNVAELLSLSTLEQKQVIIAHLHQMATYAENAAALDTAVYTELVITAAARNGMSGSAFNAMRDVFDDLGGHIGPEGSYVIPTEGLAKFKRAVDNQLLGTPTGVTGIPVAKGLGYSVSDYDKAVRTWNKAEPVFSFQGVQTATETVTIHGIEWTLVSHGFKIESIAPNYPGTMHVSETGSAIAAGLVHHLQAAADLGPDGEDVIIAAAVFDHAPQVKQAILDAIGHEALLPSGDLAIPIDFLDGTMQALANPLAAVATPEPIAALPSPVAAAPGPAKLVTDYGLNTDSLATIHDLGVIETPLTYGFTNYAYGGSTGYGAVIKNRLSGKTLTWESITFSTTRFETGIQHIGKMVSILDANPGVKTVRFLKPEQLPPSWKKLLTDHGGVVDPEKGIVVMQADDLKALSKWIDEDLAGKGVSAPSHVAAAVAAPPTVAMHTLYGIEDDAFAAINQTQGYFQPTSWNGGPYTGKQNLHVGKLGPVQTGYGGNTYQAKHWTGFGHYKVLKSGLRWDEFGPYGGATTEAEKVATGYAVLHQLLKNASSVNLGLLVPTDTVRKAGVSQVLKDAGSIKKPLKKGGEEYATLTADQAKALLAKMDADVTVVVEPIPAPAAIATPPPAAAAVVAPEPPPAIVVPEPVPVGPPKISSTYGYDGSAVEQMMTKPDAHLIVQSGGTTPHGEVYVDHWTLPAGSTAKVRWAEEKFGDAYILHVRDVTTAGQGSAGNSALVASLAKTIRDRIAGANGKFSSVLIDNKAMSQQMSDMLVAAGGKQTKGYIRLTASQIETLSGEVAKDTADWVGQSVVSAASPVPKVSGVVLPKGAPKQASPSFIYGYDPAAVSKAIAAEPVTSEVLVPTVATTGEMKGKQVNEAKTLVAPAGVNAGLTWSLSPSGKAVGIFSVVSNGDAAATRDAVFAALKRIADEATSREKLFVKPEAYDAIPGLRQMLLDAGGVETSYPALGTAIQMTSEQASHISASLAMDTMAGLKVSITASSEYLKFDTTAFQSMVLDPPKPLVGGHAWRPSGATADTQAIVTLANDGRRAEWKGLVGGAETTNPLVAAAELNWLAEQGVEELRVGMQVIAAAPLFDKFLLANGATVSGNELVLDAKAINAARIHLTKDALPVLLGGKALPYSVIDSMAANGALSVEAAAHFTLSPKGTSQLMRTTIGGIESTATIVRSDANILWRESGGGTLSAGGRRAAAVAHLRNLLNWSAQDVGLRRLDIGTAVLRDVPNLRAVLEKYGATEVAGVDGYLSLDRARVMKLRADLEAEFAEISPAGKTYIGQQAASIQWPTADELTETKVALTGQTAKNVFTDKAGNQWLFKPGASGRGAATDKAVAELAQLLGLNVPPVRHYSLTVDGKVVAGSLQKMLPGAKSIKAISDLTPGQQADVLRHSVLDWLTNNDDAHIGNWLIDDNGRMWSIDKSRSWSTLNDGLHDTLRTDNEGNAGGTPLLFKFWRDVKRDPGLLKNIKPQDLAPVLRTLRNMSDDEFRRIVEPVAALTNRGKYAGKPDAMITAMLARKNAVVTDFERYFKTEIDSAIRTNSAAVPELWKQWANNGGTFNLDATPVDLLGERLTEREARWGPYTPAKFQQLANDNAFSKVRSEVHSYYDGGTSGSGSHFGAELIRPRLNPKAEADWRELNEWATLSILLKDQTAVHDALGYGIEVSGLHSQAELLRKFFNHDTGTVRLVRSTNRYKLAGRADVPQAYVDGMAKDGIRNLTGYALGKHVVIQAHGGVYYYSDVDPAQLFTWWGLGHGAGAGESEILVSDVRPDQVIAIRPQSKPLPQAGLGYDGPLIESLVAALAGMLIEA